MNARAPENYLAISRSSSASKSVEIYWGRLFLGPNLVSFNRHLQTSGESASLPQYLGCNTVFDMRLRVTFLRRKTVSLQSNIAHREQVLKWRQ